MAKQTLIAKDDLRYPEYPRAVWLKGERYSAVEKDGLLILESEHGLFYFGGEAKERLLEVFDIGTSE